MGKSCVECHNSHPDSPKRDWKVGDVRGFQAIDIPTAFASSSSMENSHSFDQIIVFFGLAFGSAFLAILFLVGRNKRAFARVNEHAENEAINARELELSNVQLEKSLGELNAILGNAADSIITISTDGTIISVNSATERMFGYQRNELMGESINLLMAADDASKHDARIANYLETGEAQIIGVGREVLAKRKSGELFPVEISIGEVAYADQRFFTGILRDVSERKEAELELRNSRETEKMLSLVASGTDNAVIITDRKGLIKWVNRGFERISGYSSDQAVGFHPGTLLQGPATDRSVTSAIAKSIDEYESFNAELINYSSTGEEYWVQIDAKPVFSEDGSFDGYIAIERDVTELKNKAIELEDAKAAAEESNQAKSRFLAMMSHEIRTPLNAIVGILGLIEDEDDQVERKKFTDTARKSSESLQTIISDILDISKLEANVLELEFETIDTSMVLNDVANVMHPRAQEKNLNFDVIISEGLPTSLTTDVARVRQILVNFVSNALKFTDHGKVTIQAYHMPTPLPTGAIRFQVDDTGVGISDEDQAKIFDEFWTKNLSLRNTSPGTGLGLAICEKLASSLGGQIGMSSQLGRGSSFWLDLPLSSEETRISKPQISDPSELPENFAGHVLIAEDNSANQMVIAAMLNKIGVTSDIVANGIEAISAVKLRSYDAIFMDVNMPEMDGITATRTIRDLGLASETPVIAMTAHVTKGDKESLVEDGLDD